MNIRGRIAEGRDRLQEGRAFRAAVIAQWGRADLPTRGRLYGRGTIVQHYALDTSSSKALCGGSVTLVSEFPFTSKTGLQCPLCVSVVARILVRAAAEEAARRRG